MLERQQSHAEVCRTPDKVYPTMTCSIGSQTRLLSFGRFLLSSTGVHLILAWVIISFGFPGVPSVPKPLVVTIIGSDSSGSPDPSGGSDRTHSKQPAARESATPPVNSKARAHPRVSPSAPASATSSSTREEPVAPDERVAEPKAVGASVGRSGIGDGMRGALAAGSPAPGPVLLSSDGDGAVGSGQAGRSGTGRLDAALIAPSTPSVTVGSAQGSGGGGAGGFGYGSAGGRFSSPNYGMNPLPKYPLVAREKGYEGTVYLRVLVRVDGRVERLTVDRSSGYEILDRAAIDSVKEWAFFPAKKGGKSVESWVLLPVKFALN